MKKWICLVLALILTAALLAGCGQKEARPRTKVYVFAAASLTETLQEIKALYEQAHPDVEIVLTLDSSGTLKTMIQEGANCDLFLSAGKKQMDQLDIQASPEVNTEGLDFVQADTRCDLLENKVALCVPAGNPGKVESFDGMKAGLEAGSLLLAMGNADVPVGQYTQKIFSWYGLDEAELAKAGCITYGGNVKEVASQIGEGAVDCGVIYQTDAFSAKLTVVDTAAAEMCGRVIYPAAVLKTAKHAEQAKAFLDYLKTAEAAAIFEQVGFTPLG